MTAAALASGVVSSVISCAVWELGKVVHRAAWSAVRPSPRGRHRAGA